MTDPEARLRALHAKFCLLSGRNYRYEQWRHDWYQFDKAGYTEDDMTLVMAFANKVNAQRERRYAIVTSIAKVIADLSAFDNLRAEADLEKRRQEARKRAFQPTAGQVALAEMRREAITPPETPAKPARDVFMAWLDKTKEQINNARQ